MECENTSSSARHKISERHAAGKKSATHHGCHWPLGIYTVWFDNLLQPRHPMLHVERMCFEELNHVPVDIDRSRVNAMAVDSQKYVNHGEGNTLVAIDERVILNEAFDESGSLMNDRIVVAGLRSMQSRFEGTGVANTGRAAVTFDQLFVEEKRVSGRDVLRHLASDR